MFHPFSPVLAGGFVSRADSLPRKVIVGTTMSGFSGDPKQRQDHAAKLMDEAARMSAEKYSGRGPDLIVLTEYAIRRQDGSAAKDRAIGLDDPVITALGRKAGELHSYLVLPMVLREKEPGKYSNAAILFDRSGAVAGIYRKVHPVAYPDGSLEGGVMPGRDYQVFNCDFGKLGILICWDMAYEEAWQNLADKGAEMVVLASASPQTLRPMAAALRHRFYVVNSTPRDNATIFNPIGLTVAQTTQTPVLVQEIDLAYAILPWSGALEEGRGLTKRFGDKIGYNYSTREDTGVFWSNDPQMSIRSMIKTLGLREMPEEIERSRVAREKAL